MSKRNIAVIFGSRSAEHDISIVTAISSIIEPLELVGGYNIIPVYISKNGNWYSEPKLRKIETFTSKNFDAYLSKLKPVSISFYNGLDILKPGLKNKKIRIDVAFPATHGTYGEDGDLMGVLDMANIPYVGCNLASSAICMDKVLAKEVAESFGVITNEYEWFFAYEFKKFQKQILDKLSALKFPLFVKPAHLGSSIAITKVANQKELVEAIEVASFYDDKIIVEEAVENLVEVTVPLMGNEEIVCGNTEEPNQGAQFFDFSKKYLSGGKNKAKTGAVKGSQGYSHIPARISEDMRNRCIEIAKNVYLSIGCSGIARVDLLIDSKSGKIYFNEVNPLPGSLYAHNWNSVGISKVDLVQKLINYADQRWQSKQKVNTTFNTKFLQQF